MNIAILTAHLSPRAGGFWQSVRHLAGGLSQIGVETALIGLCDRRASEADITSLAELKAMVCKVNGPNAFGFSRTLLPALRQVSPDIVHAQGIWMYPSLASLKWHRQSRRPYMVSPRGMLDAWALGRSSIKKRAVSWWFEREHLESATCLHALNAAEAMSIRAQGLGNPICIVPNGVRIPTTFPANKPAWAEDLESGTRVLLYLGRLHPKKGLVTLLRAWQHVIADADREGWCLVVAGWDQGGHARELSRLIEELCLGRSVRLVGPQFDRDKEMSFGAASAFILPALSEGLPVGVLEAWSYGLPVLMTPHCNLHEGFTAGAAIEFQAETSSIAEALHQLFQMPAAERNEIGTRGRRLAEKRFSWDKIAADMRDVYAWLLGEGSLPACVAAGATGLP